MIILQVENGGECCESVVIRIVSASTLFYTVRDIRLSFFCLPFFPLSYYWISFIPFVIARRDGLGGSTANRSENVLLVGARSAAGQGGISFLLHFH